MQTTFSTQAQKHFCPADPYSTSIPAAVHIQLQRCKGHSLVSFSYLGSSLIFFLCYPLIAFSCFQDFTSLASSVPSLLASPLILLFCWIYYWVFCPFIFCGNSSRPALLGGLTHDDVVSTLSWAVLLSPPPLHKFDSLILSFILHIFVASPESLGLSWVCQALDNCLRWRRALDDSTPWRNFTSLRIVELQTFYFLDGKACFQHTSWETPYIAKFSVLNDLPIHPHWREHWRNTEIEAIPVFLKEDAFVCSPSCLFWLCASVWIPAPLISVSPLTLQCQLFII